MPKINRGRLDGVYGMEKRSSEELYDWANTLEAQIESAENTDNIKWLKRRANEIRILARQKENAIVHRENQR